MRSHSQGRRTHDQGGGRDLPRFMGVTAPCFTIPNADLTTHLPRLDSTMQIFFSHQADLFSLDWPSRTPPINTKLKTTFKRLCWHAHAQPHRIQKKDVTCSRTSPRPGAPGREICTCNTFGTPGGILIKKLMVETRAQAKLKNKTVEMTSEAPESTSPITVTETEHVVRSPASDPITTDRTAESVQEQAVVEDLMDK
ncbi:unnamed protein product, partial [Prunus brigantina]